MDNDIPGIPETNYRITPIDVKGELAIFVASTLADHLVRVGIYDQGQAQLLFDRLTDMLIAEDQSVVLDLLPKAPTIHIGGSNDV